MRNLETLSPEWDVFSHLLPVASGSYEKERANANIVSVLRHVRMLITDF